MQRVWSDYQGGRVFTIEEMITKDLDGVLNTDALTYGREEMGIHISNVYHFINIKYHVEKETQ